MDMGRTQVPGTEGAEQAATAQVPSQPLASTQPPSGTVPPSGTPPPPGGQVPPPQSQPDHQTRTILVIIALFLFYPLGLILMYTLTNWKGWVKFLITLPVVLFIIGLVAAVVLVAVDPAGQIQKAECVSKCQESSDVQACIAQCIEMPVITPTENIGPTGSEIRTESTTEEPSTVYPSGPVMEY